MKRMDSVRTLTLLAPVLAALALVSPSAAQTGSPPQPRYPGLPSETPAKVEPSSLETARPIAANEPLKYRFALPTANHVFLPGHRIMVQIQSSWFPLYDRNPQTFVPNIFWARPGDYRKALQRIYHAFDQASFVELPLVVTP